MAIYTRTGDAGTTSLRGGKRVSKGGLQIHILGTIDELNTHLGLAVAMIKSIEHAWGRLSKQKAEMLQRNIKLGNGFERQEHVITELQSARERLIETQKNLFEIGSAIGNFPLVKLTVHISQDIAALEQWIDESERDLPELKNFILPGGNVASAQIMVARAVARRSERELVRWIEQVSNQGRFQSRNKRFNRNDSARDENRTDAQESAFTQNASEDQPASSEWTEILMYSNRLSDWLFMLARRVNWVLEEEEQLWVRR